MANRTFGATTERAIAPKVREFFVNGGWKVKEEVKLRGRMADIVATKDDNIAVIEVKGYLGDLGRGVEQALHYKHAANFAYLAVPEQRSSKEIETSCRNLGVGLLLVNDGVAETVRPERSQALASVRTAVSHARPRGQPTVRLRTSLERLFRSRAQVLILKLFFLNPRASFHLNEIGRKTGLSPSVALKECSVLLSLGLVRRSAQGNLTLYQINRESVIHEELKRIFLKYEFLDDLIAGRLPSEKVKYALIFGSFARGTENEGSDVDLLVVADIDEEAVLKAVNEVERKTGREVNYNLWTEAEFEDKNKQQIPLLREISKTPVVMIVGDENEFKRSIAQRNGRKVPV